MGKNNIQQDRPQMAIQRMRVACWIPTAINTTSEYLTLIAFPQQQWLHKLASMLHYTYISFLFLYRRRNFSVRYELNLYI